jgi:hypothetical protein
VKEDEEYDDKTMSVFHGLRADLEGYVLSTADHSSSSTMIQGLVQHASS